MLKRLCILTSCLLILTACGGGGGGSSGSGDGGDSPGFSLLTDLQQDDFWEFYWFDSTSTFAQGSGTNTSTDYGIFKVTLGAPLMVNGLEAYPLLITGDAGPYEPRWSHIAIDDNGSILGSTNGLNFEIIYDASTDQWTGGGFFHDFGSNPVAASDGDFSGEYNNASAVRLGYSDSEGGCETILGNTICEDTSTTFSFYEYYKSGVGPIGFRQDTTYTSDGGGFFTSHVLRKTVELIETSETALDMTTFNRPDWEEVAPMSQARRSPKAVVLNGEIWVLGGYDQSGGNTLYSSVEVYDPASNSWSAGPAMPSFGGPSAHVLNGKIHIQSYTDSDMMHIYNPAGGGSWSTVAVSGASDGYFGGGDFYDDMTFGFFESVLGLDGATYLEASAVITGYSADSNQWLNGAGFAVYELLRPSISIVGDTLYAIGGFGGSSSSNRGARDEVYRYDIINDVWLSPGASMSTGRDSLATVVLGGDIIAIGGNAVTCTAPGSFETCNFGVTYRSVESYDPLANSWTDLGSMLNPRQDFAVVELDGKLYVIGGYNGEDELASVERYTPP